MLYPYCAITLLTKLKQKTSTQKTFQIFNGEKVKPVALDIIKLHLSEGTTSQLLTQSVENSFK